MRTAFLIAALLSCAAAGASAQQRPPGPMDAAAPAAPLAYDSAFSTYRADQPAKVLDWKATNAAIAGTPGHGAHAGHAMGAAPAADPHAGHKMHGAAPAKDKPAAADPHAGHMMHGATPAKDKPAATDPHAGHKMPTPAAKEDPHAGHKHE